MVTVKNEIWGFREDAKLSLHQHTDILIFWSLFMGGAVMTPMTAVPSLENS